jgi:holo-[acyl-carrier protein] synthase
MAIVGTGVDLAEVSRLQAALEDPRTGARFRTRVFTEGEQRYCERRGVGRYQSYAARFAAKEATMKALGHGWGRHVGWLDVEVVRAEDGRPMLRLHGKAAVTATAVGATRLHLALTHTRDMAVAQVVLEDDARP